MVSVADRIWEYWRAAEECGEPSIVMLFTSPLSQGEALAAVQDAASEAIREREALPEPAPGEDEERTGHWSAAPVPGGVALRIDEEPHDFEGLVRRIAAVLELAGVEGAFDLYEPEVVVELPRVVDLLECRLRVKGERYHLRGHKWRWNVDPDALAAGVATGLDWCLANGTQLPLSFVVGLVASSTLRAEDDIAAYLREAVELTAELGVIHLTSAAPDRFRTMAVQASMGRVSLIEGGATIESAGWQPSLQQLRARVESAASWAAYGFVKRGSHLPAAIQGSSLSQDWVPVPHFDAGTSQGVAFENEHVPDAFGIQLLGPGYAGRVPDATDWTQTPVGAGGVIVEHADPGAWFDGGLHPFRDLRPATTRDAMPIPDLVARARDDFAGILFTVSVAREEPAG